MYKIWQNVNLYMRLQYRHEYTNLKLTNYFKLSKFYKTRTVIIRFMGTSRESSTANYLLESIIKQVKEVFAEQISSIPFKNENIQQQQYQRTFKNLKDDLVMNLNRSSKDEKIIILLDSIDQLSEQDRKNLDWMLLDELPSNLKVIYSVLDNYEGIYEKLKRIVGKDNTLKIEPTKIEEANLILETLLKKVNRRLTSEQWAVIQNLIQNIPEIYPLHLKLLFDISSKWKSSYQIPQNFNTCLTIKDTIKYLFKRLEGIFGEILFKRCIFYLTLFDYKGIGEAELEDILSIDDDLLTSVFQFHHPPLRKFPIALWLNIKYELKEYITNKETDGVSVIAW